MKKHGIIVLLLLASISFLFADGFTDLQKAISSKDTAKVRVLLESSGTSKSDFENEILKQAKTYVANDDLDYASELAELVLMYNFDNNDAQKLYTSIEKAKKSKAEADARKQLEEQKKAEEERKRKEAEEEKRQLEEFKEQKKKEEQAKNDYIESVSSISFSNFPMSFGFALPVEFMKSAFADEFNNNSRLYTRMGVGFVGNIAFVHPYFNAKAHVNYNFLPINFMKCGMKSDFRSRLSIGTDLFSEWFRITVGYNTFSLINNDSVVLYESITAPTIGFGVDNVKIADFLEFGLFTDINLITFDANTQINYAYDVDFTARYYLPVKALGLGKLYIEDEIVFSSIVLSKESEYTISSILSVGVSINE